MKRVFFALTLDDMVKDELAKVQEMVRPMIKKGKFVPPSLFHLTLQFLGELEEEEVLRLNELAFDWLNQFNPLELTISNLGYFQKRNRWILWAGVDKNPVLDQLSYRLKETMAQQGYENHQFFIPHITLGREVRFNNEEAQAAYDTIALTPTSFTVDGFHLMESGRLEGKLHYGALKKFPFGGNFD